MLEDIVGGPALESLDGHFFAERARHKNEGYFRALLFCDLEGGHSVKRRQRAIGEDQVRLARIDRLLELRAGLRSTDPRFDSLRVERCLDELGVKVAVFEVQYLQGPRHDYLLAMRRPGLQGDGTWKNDPENDP